MSLSCSSTDIVCSFISIVPTAAAQPGRALLHSLLACGNLLAFGAGLGYKRAQVVCVNQPSASLRSAERQARPRGTSGIAPIEPGEQALPTRQYAMVRQRALRDEGPYWPVQNQAGVVAIGFDLLCYELQLAKHFLARLRGFIAGVVG